MIKRLKYIFVFLIFLISTLFLYRNTTYSRFVFDFVDWHSTYQQQGWQGLFHSFNDPSLHHVYHFFFFLFDKMFGLNEVPWHILFCLLHACNALLLFSFLKTWLGRSGFRYAYSSAVIAATLFLVSPYQTEVVVWGATIHYLLAVLFALGILNLFLRYAKVHTIGTLPAVNLLFFTALFTHEIIIVLPLIISVLIAFSPTSVFSRNSRVGLMIKIVLPQLILILAYFTLNRIVLGKWIAHYGAATHLHFNLCSLTSAFLKYLFKYLFFAQFLPDSLSSFFYTSTDNHIVLVVFFVLCFMLFAVATLYRARVNVRISALLIVLVFISLFPVLNLYFPYWINIQADRLGYFASLFIYSFIVIVLFSILKHWAWMAATVLLIISISCLMINTNNWQHAGSLLRQLETNFPPDRTKHYYILNLPDNFNGAYMFRSLGDSKLAAAMKLNSGIDRTQEIKEIYGYNLQTVSDSVFVSVVDSNTLKVELSHWGNWWWRFTESAVSFEDESVKIVVDDYNHTYLITFKDRKPDDVILYQAASEWHEVYGF